VIKLIQLNRLKY